MMSETPETKWEFPPEPPAGLNLYSELVICTGHPGVWRRVYTNTDEWKVRTRYYDLRSEKRKSPPGKFELQYGPVEVEEGSEPLFGLWARIKPADDIK